MTRHGQKQTTPAAAHPELIIETPRVGNAGHRFLTSSAKFVDSQLAELTRATESVPVGADYISISRTVRQRLENGTVRNATERIILHGIVPDRLSPQAKERVMAQLEDVARDADQFVAEAANHLEDQSLRIVVPALQDRATDIGRLISTEARADEIQTARSGQANKNRGGTGRVVLTLLGLLLLLIAGIRGTPALWKMFSNSSVTNSEDSDNGQRPTESQADTSVVSQLAQDWGCDESEVVRSLLRAANWDRRHEISHRPADELRNDGEVLSLAQKVKQRQEKDESRIDAFLLSPALRAADKDRLKRWLTKCGITSSQDVTHVRQWLYESASKLCALQGHVENNDLKDRFAESRALRYAQLIHALSDVSVGDLNCSELQQKGAPETPLFDRQDAWALDAVTQAATLLQQHGIVNGQTAPSEFFQILSELNRQLSGVSQQLEQDKEEKHGDNSVNTAFDQLKAFLKSLADMPQCGG